MCRRCSRHLQGWFFRGYVVDRASLAILFALRLLNHQIITIISTKKRTAFTLIPILPPKGRVFRPFGGLTTVYFCANTWSVIRVSPATVGVDAGMNLVTGSE